MTKVTNSKISAALEPRVKNEALKVQGHEKSNEISFKVTVTQLIYPRGDAEGRITRPIKTEINIVTSFVTRLWGHFLTLLTNQNGPLSSVLNIIPWKVLDFYSLVAFK